MLNEHGPLSLFHCLERLRRGIGVQVPSLPTMTVLRRFVAKHYTWYVLADIMPAVLCYSAPVCDRSPLLTFSLLRKPGSDGGLEQLSPKRNKGQTEGGQGDTEYARAFDRIYRSSREGATGVSTLLFAQCCTLRVSECWL
jgi:hypothetical protein